MSLPIDNTTPQPAVGWAASKTQDTEQAANFARDVVSLVRVTREVRLSFDAAVAENWDLSERIPNTWAGLSAGHFLAPFVRLRATIRGAIDQKTGFICNAKEIDTILWQAAHTAISETDIAALPAPGILAVIANHCHSKFASHIELYELEIATTPYLRYTTTHLAAETSSMVRITHQFEFSAAHRLRSDELSNEQNRTFYGKCGNPAGHGHNYVIDVTLACETDESHAPAISLDEFQQVVDREVISRFDHKNLDVDCEEFRELPSTVENLTTVIFRRLKDRFSGAQLHSVRVYETPKTWAEVTA